MCVALQQTARRQSAGTYKGSSVVVLLAFHCNKASEYSASIGFPFKSSSSSSSVTANYGTNEKKYTNNKVLCFVFISDYEISSETLPATSLILPMGSSSFVCIVRMA